MANISTTTDLVINRLSQAKYNLLCAAGQLEEYQLYITDDDQVGELSSEIDSLKSNVTTLSTELSSKLISDDIAMSYLNQHIYLSAKNQVVGDIDCADFIKDGMLSSAYLSGTILWLNFNTDAGSDPISIELSNFVDNYDGKINDLSNKIDSKIFIDDQLSGVSGHNDLSIIKLDAAAYGNLLTSDSLISNAIYVVQDDHVDAYGQQMKNLAAGTDLSDAVTVQQLNTKVDNYDGKINDLSNKIDSKIFIDDQLSGVSGHNDLSIIKLDAAAYGNLLTSDSLISNAIYVVQDDHVDAYGQQMKNLAAGTDLSDAVTVQQLNTKVDNSALSSAIGLIQKSLFNEISDPQASVRSIQQTLIQILNILRD